MVWFFILAGHEVGMVIFFGMAWILVPWNGMAWIFFVEACFCWDGKGFLHGLARIQNLPAIYN